MASSENTMVLPQIVMGKNRIESMVKNTIDIMSLVFWGFPAHGNIAQTNTYLNALKQKYNKQ